MSKLLIACICGCWLTACSVTPFYYTTDAPHQLKGAYAFITISAAMKTELGKTDQHAYAKTAETSLITGEYKGTPWIQQSLDKQAQPKITYMGVQNAQCAQMMKQEITTVYEKIPFVFKIKSYQEASQLPDISFNKKRMDECLAAFDLQGKTVLLANASGLLQPDEYTPMDQTLSLGQKLIPSLVVKAGAYSVGFNGVLYDPASGKVKGLFIGGFNSFPPNGSIDRYNEQELGTSISGMVIQIDKDLNAMKGTP